MAQKTIEAYRHSIGDLPVHETDPTRDYYTSVRRGTEPGDARLLSGPYATHAEAVANVQKDQAWAEALDAKAVWYSFGTCSVPKGTTVQTTRQKYGAPMVS